MMQIWMMRRLFFKLLLIVAVSSILVIYLLEFNNYYNSHRSQLQEQEIDLIQTTNNSEQVSNN